METYFIGVNCEHSFSWMYWMATMNNKCHSAYACDSYHNFQTGNCRSTPMVTAGYHFNEIGNSIQNYYHRTSREWPYCTQNEESESTSSTNFTTTAISSNTTATATVTTINNDTTSTAGMTETTTSNGSSTSSYIKIYFILVIYMVFYIR